MLKRSFDILAALAGLAVLWPVLLIIAIAVRLDSPGPAIHWSRRIDTPDVATHLLDDPQQWITPLGRMLRRTSLDEFPQLWSVLVGQMSLVGPRPALFNQDDLVALRTEAGVHRLRPGVTGWAQINGRDDLPIPDKVRLDAEYATRRSLVFDIRIILITLRAAVAARGVSH